MSERDPFYVGYLPLPQSIKRFMVPWLFGNVVLAVGIAVVVASNHREPGDGSWETFVGISIEGEVVLDPYPALRTDHGTYILVEQGKIGAHDRVNAMGLRAGDLVIATGSPIERDGRLVLEIYDQSSDLIRSPTNSGPSYVISYTRSDAITQINLGTHTLVGEIVDPKCYLGVMQPGDGKTHKVCATLCIKGGIPPMLLVRNDAGETAAYLLTDSEGKAFPESHHEYIADPIEITGQVLRDGDLLILRADLDSIKRLE